MTSIRPKTRDGSSAGGLGRVTQLLLDAQQLVVLGDALRHEGGSTSRSCAPTPVLRGRIPGVRKARHRLHHDAHQPKRATTNHPRPEEVSSRGGGGPLRQVRRSLRPQCGEVRDACRESHGAHSSGPSAGRPPSRTEPRARPDWTRSAQARWSPGTTASDQRGGRRWPRHPRGR